MTTDRTVPVEMRLSWPDNANRAAGTVNARITVNDARSGVRIVEVDVDPPTLADFLSGTITGRTSPARVLDPKGAARLGKVRRYHELEPAMFGFTGPIPYNISAEMNAAAAEARTQGWDEVDWVRQRRTWVLRATTYIDPEPDAPTFVEIQVGDVVRYDRITGRPRWSFGAALAKDGPFTAIDAPAAAQHLDDPTVGQVRS